MTGAGSPTEPSSPSPGRDGHLGRSVLLVGAVLVFATCLILSFIRAAQHHEAALRDIGANLRVAFQADNALQRLRHSFDLYASGGDAVDRDLLRARHERLLEALQRLSAEPGVGTSGEAGADPIARIVDDAVRLGPALQAFQPGDATRYADLAVRLDEIGAPLRRIVTDADAIAVDEAGSTHRRWLYVEEVLYLAGMLGSGGVFIAMLLRESRRTRRLLAEATHAQTRIEHLAHHDPLTDLPNRWLFKDRLDQALRLAQRHQPMVALHCVDIDHFKTVNDRYGHVTGDKVLVAVAKRMQACLRQSDTLARLGGDEFAIVQTAPTDSGATHLAERLLEAFQVPLAADGHELKTTVSVGIALYPEHAATAEALHRAADTALYCAKAAGRDRFHVWRPDDDRPGMPVRYSALAG
jgi:diguanylate cyclase (GGDEF)-like protein